MKILFKMLIYELSDINININYNTSLLSIK